ncbi:MAG: hypothetical protein KBA31_17070 [Alphaproteobacteria bacterium]|nr:hypothetical protein [Alphaproteobacteria bacterium]
MAAAQILNHRVHLDREPLLEHGKRSGFWPIGLVRVPRPKFVFEHDVERLGDHLIDVAAVGEIGEQIDRLLVARVGPIARIVERRSPVEKRLRRTNRRAGARDIPRTHDKLAQVIPSAWIDAAPRRYFFARGGSGFAAN